MCGFLFKTVVCSQYSHMFDARRQRYALIVYYYGRYYSFQFVLFLITYRLFVILYLYSDHIQIPFDVIDEWIYFMHSALADLCIYDALGRPSNYEGAERFWGKSTVVVLLLMDDETPRFSSLKSDYLQYLAGGNPNIFLFSPLFGEMIQFDQCFSDGLKPPTRICFVLAIPVWWKFVAMLPKSWMCHP